MQVQLGEVIGNQNERLFPALSPFAPGQRDFSFHVATGLSESLSQERDVFMGPFDAVKRRFGFVTHSASLSPPIGIAFSLLG